jgi:hypothetical protein
VSLSGDIPVPHCRRCGSRQSGHRRQAWLARSGFSNIDKAKSRDRLKQNPARWTLRVSVDRAARPSPHTPTGMRRRGWLDVEPQ